MDGPITQLDHNGFTIQIFPDADPMNPREYDNLGHMVCWHKRYSLGDKHEWSVPQDFQEWVKEQKGRLFMLPLYLYDHSGITMSTSPFSCPWDSGQVGYIYATRDEVLKEFNTKRITKTVREKVEKILKGEVVIYDKYLTGAFVGYTVTASDGEQIDSCWGFDDMDFAISSAREFIDGYIQRCADAV